MPAPCRTVCRVLAASVPDSGPSGGVLTSVKVAMGVLAVLFFFVVTSFCLVARKSNTRADSTSLPRHHNPLAFVARRKSGRCSRTSVAVSIPGQETHHMSPYRPPSVLSLSGSTLVDVHAACPVVYPQVPSPAHLAYQESASHPPHALHS